MALPILRSLSGCASFAKTVEPFVEQLYRLPNDVIDAATAAFSSSSAGMGSSAGGLAPLLQLYLNTNPLVFGLAVSLVLGAVFFVVSEINDNYSQVDRCWSLLPTVYIAHFGLWARLAGVPSAKLDSALLFSVVWSARLTFNYARKGGYNVGSEDYRWVVVRNAIPAWLFHVFNLTFISFFQSVLLFAIAAPAYTLLLTSTLEPERTTADAAFAAVELGIILVEWIADQQQWDFQAAKAKYQASAKVPAGYGQAELDRGFLSRGLWAHSRHPNFAAEQTVWLVLYQWSCYSSNVLYSWAGIGAGVLVLLFQGSTWLTEQITRGKYPEYKDYQKQVGMFVPTTLSGYKAPAPRVIRTSELARRQAEKEAKASGRELADAAQKR